MNPSLVACLDASPPAPGLPPTEDVAAWWPQWLSLGGAGRDSAALAIAGGFAADRVGWAFAAGYQAALRALLPALPHDTLAAFCVTETAGNRPRDIRTAITVLPGGTLQVDGAKRWTTLGPAGTELLVVGALAPPADSARPALRVVRVPVPSAGLELRPMPPTRFVPEVPHAEVHLQRLQLPEGAMLPGDGYDAFVKPLRTIEDLHVTMAVLAYLLREARARGWPAAFAEELLATLALLSALAAEDVSAASTHVALAGALRFAHRLYADAAPLWAAAGDDPASRRWQRDAALFEVAGSARRQRAERAWQRLGTPPAGG